MGHGHAHSHDHGTHASDTPLGKKHARVLKAVFAINAVMAVVEGVTGYLAHSKAMMADTLDMAGDALTAGSSLMVQDKSKKWQAGVALAKAVVMGAMGAGVLIAAAVAVVSPVLPAMAAMGIVGGLALAANTASYLLLYPYRNDNINMKSTIACMKNDMLSNVGVLAAAGIGYALMSPIPDIIMGVAISGLFLKSAYEIGRESIGMLIEAHREEKKDAPAPSKPQHKHAPKHTFSLKKAVSRIFNRKAANNNEAAPAPKAEATPAAPQQNLKNG
ncbi:MAG: cation transporter [Alphaproteobacteria bacterium]